MKWKIAPIIWNTICSILGITLPLNKITFATFTKGKTNYRLSLQIPQAFQPYKIYNIWSWDDTPTKYFKNSSINRHYIAFNKNVNKTLLKYQTNGRLSLEMWWAFQQYQIHKFWKCKISQNNWNTICYIIGIILPLNKTTFATFTKYRTNVMLTLEIWERKSVV